MPITLPEANLVYFPIPKVACTSLKQFFYEVRNKKRFSPPQDTENRIHIHNHSPEFLSGPFRDAVDDKFDGMHRVTVVRDPAARILSSFSNRVLQHGELDENHIDMDLAQKLGVGPRPSIKEFISNLEEYRLLSKSIRHHTDSQAYFIGPNLDYFTHVYALEEIGKLTSLVNALAGSSVTLRHEQASGVKVSLSDISAPLRTKLYEYCYGDYALLKDFYVP